MAKLTITIEIDDTDQLVLKNDLTDINDWVQAAMTGQLEMKRKLPNGIN